MATQIELPFSVKKEDDSENSIISEAVRNKGLLQEKVKELQKDLSCSDTENIICLEFKMKLTQVCDSKEDKPDDPRVYLRRISGQLNIDGCSEKHKKISAFYNAIIPTWVDAMFLRQNWVGRELLADTFRQIAGLKYADSVWDEIIALIENEKKLNQGRDSLVVLIFNHPILPSDVVPSDTEAVIELIKEGENVFKFLKSKANASEVVLVGQYRYFFPIDRLIRDVEKMGFCNKYSFKKHFDTDYLLLNNALSPIQDVSSKGWPQIIYPPNIADENYSINKSETYFFTKWYDDDPFCCYEVVGDINKPSFVKLASFIKKRDPKREDQTK